MGLFFSKNDSKMISHFGRELIERVIDITVDIFKQNVSSMKTNLYGESIQKSYFDPVRVPAVILRDPPANAQEDFGYNQTQDVTFQFHRETLKEFGVVPEVGDRMDYDGKHYETSHVFESTYWGGINPNLMSDNEDRGMSVGIIVVARRQGSSVV